MSLHAYQQDIQQHQAMVQKAERLGATAIADTLPTYEDAKARIFAIAKEEYGHLPAGDRMRQSVEGIDALIASLRGDEQTSRVVLGIEYAQRIRAELVAIVASKRRPA